MSVKAVYRRHAPKLLIDTVDEIRQSRLDLANCVRELRATFPDIAVKHARLISSGFDHLIVSINFKYMFRFPRTPLYRAHLPIEISVLGGLDQALRVNVPRYRFVAPAGRFAGYARVPGVEMTPSRFTQLPRCDQRDVARQFVEFLNALHATPSELLARAGEPLPTLWRSRRYAGGDHLTRRDTLAPYLEPDDLARLDRFFARYGAGRPAASRVIHGDLVQNHLLLDPSRRLGVIDFGELALGDPAWDLAVLSSYDDWVGPFMLESYDFATHDPDLLGRAHMQAVRFWAERLFYKLSGNYKDDDLKSIGLMLNRSLSRIDV